MNRVMERPYPQRVDRADAKVAVIPSAHAPPAEASVDYTDTVVYRTPAIELAPQVRDNERILPPGASGPHGGAYKMLRTQVLRRLDQLGANTLGILSARRGDGKTLTAINLAIAIAADPARSALLVDFDLRAPSVHRRFQHEPASGVEECLQRAHSVREAMFKVAGYERLTILPAKAAIEHSAELLSSHRAGELVAELRARYANRIVIFDLPPVLQTDDALAFASHLQAGLLVVGERRTRRDDVIRTLQLLGDLTFVGTVLNASRERVDTHY